MPRFSFVRHKCARVALFSLLVPARLLISQELDPNAYSTSPVGVNILALTNNLSSGDLSFDPTIPIEEAKATINTTALAYVRSLNFLGRSSNLGVVLPYTLGNLEGRY